jgi:D-sedoheptulose 7-phosphate isomerase
MTADARRNGQPGHDEVERDVIHAQLEDHRALAGEVESLLPVVRDLTARLCEAFEAGARVYTFGNGGSAADAQHFAAELIGRYKRERRPLPAVALTVDPSVLTCIANDFDFDQLFARQIEALALPGDIVIGFTTSGQSSNVINGLDAARRAGATSVLFGGGEGGAARDHADVSLLVPSTVTARIQEMHLLFLHLVSEGVDQWATGERHVPARSGRSGRRQEQRAAR